jgi:parvulin-like peptidyl-prolyl isomerase
MLRFLRGSSGHTRTIWWAIAIITIFGFVFGFIFLFGARIDPGARSSSSDAGRVNGQSVTAQEYQSALQDQRANYRQQFGAEPAERDERMVEIQAWRSIVSRHLLTDEADKLGLQAHDHEVLIALETSPPQQVTQMTAFQTDGKFDVSKYKAALRNPESNWSPVEDLVRQELPARKLQERLLASIKVPSGEVERLYHERNDRLDGAVVQILPDMTSKVPAPSEADLSRVYDEYRGRFSSGLRVQLEVLTVPKKFGPEEVRTANEMAKSLADRARNGEDFGQLAKDYSEGPGAANGGVVPRVLQASDLGPELLSKLGVLKVGGISDPVQDQARFMIFKLLERPDVPGSPVAGFRVAQIMIRVKPDDNSLRDQASDLLKLRNRASAVGLGAAAAEKGMVTTKTSYYDYNNPPTQLYGAPEAAEWGLEAKLHAVGPLFDGLDDFVLAQVVARHDGGPASRDEIAQQLRQLAEMEARITLAKPRADSVAQEIARGRSLEVAAKDHGLSAIAVGGLSRGNPDPRLAGVPEVVGAMFAAKPGEVMGPLRALNGWYFARVDRFHFADAAALDTMRTRLSSELLEQRQQSFFAGYMMQLRAKAKVVNNRSSAQVQP